MTNRRSKQKIKLQDEINDANESSISATFEISSNQIEIPLHNLVKYSRIVQEEIKRNDIFSELNKGIQKVSIKHKSSIKTFLQLLNDEETEIENEEFTDLLKLSEIFKVDRLKNVLKKYLHNHSKDFDFILSLKIEKENNKEEIAILNDDISEEMEECLISNINECLENDKIKEISVSSIYRMIEKSCRERISNDLLCSFIIKSIDERHVLFHFVEIEKLSKEIFEKLIKEYSNSIASENNRAHYFDFLPNNLSYINKLILKQKSLEKRIEELEEMKDNITKESKQKIEKMIKINEEQEKQIHKLESIKENILNENKLKEEKIEETKKINEQFKEEIKFKDEKIDKISKENIEIKEEIDHLKQIIKKEEGEKRQLNETIIQLKTENSSQRKSIENVKEINKAPIPFKIIEYLTKEVGGNVHDKKIVNVTSSSSISDNYAKNAVDINNSSNYFASDNNSNSWLKYDFINRKVHPNGYIITTRHHYDCNHPKNWVIEGSNNDNDWVILDTRQNEKSLIGLGKTRTFNIESQKEDYRYLRIRQTGLNSGFCNYLNISSLEFIGTLINIS